MCIWFLLLFNYYYFMIYSLVYMRWAAYQPHNVNCEHQILVSAVHNTNLVLQEHRNFLQCMHTLERTMEARVLYNCLSALNQSGKE